MAPLYDLSACLQWSLITWIYLTWGSWYFFTYLNNFSNQCYFTWWKVNLVWFDFLAVVNSASLKCWPKCTLIMCSCLLLHVHQQYITDPHFSTSLLSFVTWHFLKSIHSERVRWYLVVVLICISLITGNAEKCFIYLNAHIGMHIHTYIHT